MPFLFREATTAAEETLEHEPSQVTTETAKVTKHHKDNKSEHTEGVAEVAITKKGKRETTDNHQHPPTEPEQPIQPARGLAETKREKKEEEKEPKMETEIAETPHKKHTVETENKIEEEIHDVNEDKKATGTTGSEKEESDAENGDGGDAGVDGEQNEEGEEDEDADEDEDEDDEDEEKDLREVVFSEEVTDRVIVACVSLQGKRPENEDRFAVQSNVNGTSIFGVFDGHDGPKASEYCAKFLIKNITKQKSFPKALPKALERGFLHTDKKFLDKIESGGTTAIVAALEHKGGKNSVLHVANVGDSRCVASVGGKAVALSVDHKPNLPAEQARISKTSSHEVEEVVEIVQGKRVKVARVDGTLAVSRAIGDGDFKDDRDKPLEEQAVSSLPELQTVELTPEHEFVVLACDGLWDVFSNEEAVEFIGNKITSGTTQEDLVSVAKSLALQAIQKNSTDNVTVLIVKL